MSTTTASKFHSSGLGAVKDHPPDETTLYSGRHRTGYDGIQMVASGKNFSPSKHIGSAILSGLLPMQPMITLRQDVTLMNRAIAEIADAFHRGIITQAEADAVVRVVAERFALRRIDSALTTIVASHGVWSKGSNG